MKIITKNFIVLFLLFISHFIVNAQNINNFDECTIGVASGEATSDGRPIIWKTRDNSSAPDNEVLYNTSFDLKFIEIVTAGNTYAWMGVNENGFAILNSLAQDLVAGNSGFGNGSLMREALGTCSTIVEFQLLLDETNISGRSTRGNFAVLDKTGEAALYEIDGSSYWKYDTDDSLHAPEGYIIRTNFALNGDGINGSGYERFERSSNLVHSFFEGDSLNNKSILRYQMRDFSDFDSQPVTVPFAGVWISGRPYGYIFTDVSICRSSSVSATVIQGILPGESEKLTTMWTMLGQPASSITVPYWPVGATPEEANGSQTAPLCDISLQIKYLLFDYLENLHYIDSYKLLDGTGGGLWTDTFPVEDSIFYATEQLLNEWRPGNLNIDEMLTAESDFALLAYESLMQAYLGLVTDVPVTKSNVQSNSHYLGQNYPNPFNPSTRIEFILANSGYVVLKVYNLLGEEVATLVDDEMQRGMYTVTWNADKNNLSSGVYVYRIFVRGNKNFMASKKLILMK